MLAGLLGFSLTVAQQGDASPWEDLIQSTALTTGVDPSLIKAVIAAESEWNPRAVSRDQSSYGIMQLNVRQQGITIAQAFDPAIAIPWGARVLAGQLAKRNGDIALALAGYNAGTSRTDADLLQRITANTLGVGDYVQTVEDYLSYYQGQAALAVPPATDVVPADAPPPVDAGGSPVDAGTGLAIGAAVALGLGLLWLFGRGR